MLPILNLFSDTRILSVSIKSVSDSHVIGDDVSLKCTVNVTNPIGPDISSLIVEWSKDGAMIQDYISQEVSLPSSVFTSNLTLTNVSSNNAGVYNCSASINGSNSEPINDSLALCLEGRP